MGRREVLRMWTFTLFGAKTSNFFEVYGVSTCIKGVEPVWIFCRQDGGQFFSVLRGHNLWIAPYIAKVIQKYNFMSLLHIKQGPDGNN